MKVYIANLGPLKPGKIHLRCATRGRFRSNQKRPKDAPHNAFLQEFECARHEGFGDDVMYFDENGNELVLKLTQ
jgi:hypothetical protein